MTKVAVAVILSGESLSEAQRTVDDGPWMINGEQGGNSMNILWMVNTNTFLLVILIIMVSYLIMQMNALIRWLRRE